MYMLTRILSLPPSYYIPPSSLRLLPPAFILPFSADFPCSLIRVDTLSHPLPFVLRVFNLFTFASCNCLPVELSFYTSIY